MDSPIDASNAFEYNIDYEYRKSEIIDDKESSTLEDLEKKKLLLNDF